MSCFLDNHTEDKYGRCFCKCSHKVVCHSCCVDFTTVNEIAEEDFEGSRYLLGNDIPHNYLDENSLFNIKRSDLAKEIENCRPEVFNKGNKVDCMIIGLEKEKRKVALSIKELEIQNEKIAIQKYGKGGTSSGQMLGNILGKVLGSKKEKSKKKDKK